ncbi:MAG: hypothetical protein WDN00_02255 [Limisphaerales bacterium]
MIFGARIVPNPQRMDSHKEYGAKLTRLVLTTCCELRQLALRSNCATKPHLAGLYNQRKSANLLW